MSSAPPNGLLKAELQHLKAINAELLANLEFAVKLFEALPTMRATAQVEHMRAVISKAKAQP